MPMMSIETVKKSEHLIRELNGIATAKWNAVTDHSAVYSGGLVAAFEQGSGKQVEVTFYGENELPVHTPPDPAARNPTSTAVH